MDPTDEFVRLTDPFRRELLAHCYRMLGSVHEAEDLVQETYLRAWRGYDRFEGRSSLRTWLYRIATSACLRALENRDRRPLPAGLGAPSADPEQPLEPSSQITWLEPFPDALLGTTAGTSSATADTADPAEIVTSKEHIRLAFVAALQHLRAKQRAVLLLRDVLRWRAAEVAEYLGTTTAAVNSTLQRARAQLEQAAPADETLDDPADPEQRALLDRFVAAFENADVALLTRLLRDDAELEMPPYAAWFSGRASVEQLFASQVMTPCRDIRMLPTTANGQPAFASYVRSDGDYHPHGIHVLTFSASKPIRIARITVFLQPTLFPTFGLPAKLPSPTSASNTA